MSNKNLPRKVIYIDEITSWYPDPTLNIYQAAEAGFNVIILSFYLSSGPTDIVTAWANVATQKQRENCLNIIHKNNAILMISAGGGTDTPYNLNPVEYATEVATFANNHGFDGVDFDLENFDPGLKYPPMNSKQTLNWLITCAVTCRKIIGNNKSLSFAPQAPYFGKIGDSTSFVGVLGGFTALELAIPTTIDFYNVQFYNQGPGCYISYEGLFVNSRIGGCSDIAFHGTSISEIAQNGVPLNKIVLGKPFLRSDAGNDFVNIGDLKMWIDKARNELGWDAGIMTWQWHNFKTAKKWIDFLYPGKEGFFIFKDSLSIWNQSILWLIITGIIIFFIIKIYKSGQKSRK
jgi:chitinase